MPLPNFLIIGAAKSGTTALHNYLAAHPDIYMTSRKEPHFFSYDPHYQNGITDPSLKTRVRFTTSLTEYLSLFERVTTERAIGEVSPSYLPSPIAAHRVRETIPDARLIAVLRDPAERAFSQLMMLSSRGYIDLSMRQVIDRYQAGEARRIIDVGFYAPQIERWCTIFPKEQLRILFFDDFTRDPTAIVRDICAFVGVSTDYKPDTSMRYNISGTPKSQAFNRAINAGRRAAAPILPKLPKPVYRTLVKVGNINFERARLAPEDRAALIELYRDDILALQELVGRDLGKWLTV